MRRAAARGAIERKNLVGFCLQEVSYAIDIFRVREIIKPLPVHRLPALPPAVIGVAYHRGEVMPVLDLRERFGLPAEEDTGKDRWIVVKRGERTVALAAERVTEVFGVDHSQQRSIPEIGLGGDTLAISAVYADRGTLVFVIDVDRVTAVAEKVDLGAALRVLRESENK